MKRLLTLITCLTLISAQVGEAFALLAASTINRSFLTSLQDSKVDDREAASLEARRFFLEKLALIPVLVLSTSISSIEPAGASGGATAGGAYLLSAKQRYNDRVKASVAGLLKAADELKAGDSKLAKEYFSREEGGSWKDMTAAGYLLSNAFRRNSTAAPDSLPSVKKYKAFVADVESMLKVLKKKGATAASDEFSKVEGSLDAWLSEIDLPSAREL